MVVVWPGIYQQSRVGKDAFKVSRCSFVDGEGLPYWFLQSVVAVYINRVVRQRWENSPNRGSKTNDLCLPLSVKKFSLSSLNLFSSSFKIFLEKKKEGRKRKALRWQTGRLTRAIHGKCKVKRVRSAEIDGPKK